MTQHFDVAVLGAGPSGVAAATRASRLGARTALITGEQFGGMAANDGPVPVRTLAHAARLIRDARQLGRYGITGPHPRLDYRRVLGRVADVVADVRKSSFLLEQMTSQGVEIHECAGAAEFLDANRIRTASGLNVSADKFVVCTGGISKKLPIPGFEFTSTHSDAWNLTEVPGSMIVVGGGATGVQVASIFNAFGARVDLFEVGTRILPSSDVDVADAVTNGLRSAGVGVHTGFGSIEAFDKIPEGVRMTYSDGDSTTKELEAEIVVVAVGWAADAGDLQLVRAGVQTTPRGFIAVDEYLRTTSPTIYAAGDITGRIMLASEAIRDGFVAADNAVSGPRTAVTDHLTPEGSFTDPEYAAVGATEEQARSVRKVACVSLDFSECTRPIIDGQTFGFCKLVVDVDSAEVVGCHVVGDRAIDIVQVASVAMAAGLSRVDQLARVAVSFPTYAEILIHTAAKAAQLLGLDAGWRGSQLPVGPGWEVRGVRGPG